MNAVNDIIWHPVMCVFLMCAAIWFTVRLRGIQVRRFKDMVKCLVEKGDNKKDTGLSAFQAFATTVGGRVGTGNIAGTATAIFMGGPGALFWMWVTAILGASTGIVECILGQAYKTRNLGELTGGPAYYMSNGIKNKKFGRVLAVLFCMLMHMASDFFKHFFKNQYARIFVGGLIIVILTHLVGNTDYNGAGMGIITNAIHGDAKPYAFLLKMLFTCVTIGCGFRGGEIVPAFFIGSTFGCTLGNLMGLDPATSAAVGLVCFFCAVVNCPLTSILLGIELFGSDGLILFAIACAISYMMSGYYSLYSEQKIIYSKLRPHYVNLYTNKEVHTAARKDEHSADQPELDE